MKNVKTENWLGRDFNLYICIGFESLTKIKYRYTDSSISMHNFYAVHD